MMIMSSDDQKREVIIELRILLKESLDYVEELRDNCADIPSMFVEDSIEQYEIANKEMEENIAKLENNVFTIEDELYNKLLGIILLKSLMANASMAVLAICSLMTPNDGEVD